MRLTERNYGFAAADFLDKSHKKLPTQPGQYWIRQHGLPVFVCREDKDTGSIAFETTSLGEFVAGAAVAHAMSPENPEPITDDGELMAGVGNVCMGIVLAQARNEMRSLAQGLQEREDANG